MICNFCGKFKMAAIFGEIKFFLRNVLVNMQIPSKLLYRARFWNTGIFVFSLFGKFVMINQSLNTWPFLNQWMPKSNDIQILIEWMYLPSFRWIDKIPFKLSSGQAYPSEKNTFFVVWPLIGRNVTAVYSKKLPRANAYICQIWIESA